MLLPVHIFLVDPLCYERKCLSAIANQKMAPLMKAQAETAMQQLVLTLVLPSPLKNGGMMQVRARMPRIPPDTLISIKH